MSRQPWWGVFFERMVNSVKLSLRKCLRKLTYMCDEMERLLTPSHRIISRRILSMPTESTTNVGRSGTALTSARFLQRVLNHFWNRCRSEYLTELREHDRYFKRANSPREVQVGDIVCVHEHIVGKIEHLLQGRDGQVRSAVVRVKSGNSLTSE